MSDIFTAGHTPVNGVARATGKNAAFTLDIPQGATIKRIHARNTTGTTLSGGLDVGIAASGATVVAAGVVAANDLSSLVPLIGAANAAAARTLYFTAHTAWGVTFIDVAVEYTVLVPAAA